MTLTENANCIRVTLTDEDFGNLHNMSIIQKLADGRMLMVTRDEAEHFCPLEEDEPEQEEDSCPGGVCALPQGDGAHVPFPDNDLILPKN